MRLLATITVVLVTVSGCGLFKSEPGAPEITNEFLAKLASGDVQGAAGMTDNPNEAKETLEKFRGALKPEGLSSKVDQIRKNGETASEASVSLDWDLGKNRHWTYSTKFDVRQEGDTWKVHWASSVAHPKLAPQQSVKVAELKPDPAPVLDRDGTPLLAPERVVSVLLVAKEAGDVAAVSKALADALNPLDKAITAQTITEGVGKTPEGQAYQVAALRDPDYQSVKPKIYELPGVRFSSQTSLLAPSRTFGSQVLPAVRKLVENDIAGHEGFRVSTVDAQGAEVDELTSKAPEPAKAVNIALSRAIQTAAEDAVEPVTQPTMLVAIQPSTGDILAVAQNDPADAQGALSLTGRFPPGSTMKAVSALAALQSGKVTADTPLPCPGKTTIDGRRIVPNSSEFDKGTIPLRSAFAFSCNTTFAQLAVDMPAELLPSAALSLGLGADFDIAGLTTITGSVPPATDVVERAEDAFGQGKVLASPFGMALVSASIAKGSMPVPQLVRGKETKADKQPTAPTPAVLDPVRQMMREVVDYGTAPQLKPYGDVRGKTGTAQFGDGVHSHGWFMGYRGDLAFATLVLSADSSTPAVDVAAKFLKAVP
ncbi:penicillin-binding transpeptidase domain-containing protein [Lentzea sp. BCCO 10_0856]|uniref:Penicillin-binding transpeptidase domain-containing protein n=1 Tax=Lentzea miocenica TaxID=3095431 RepID=A0ABU4TGZ2_9PSEU|nr:penicillin-binding transpeptidase domain-containing protein [Lentzea sp. BCCO 10_0856]MDX8037148.1 penicillin-binding transpeptidase domain-containing protein [Lentzea sp. BCCO 10_0856]